MRLKEDRPALNLIRRIRDEAHRFAQSYHYVLRRKVISRSQLDNIPGIGPKRKKALMTHFSSLHAIMDATSDELKEFTDARTAKAIQRYFNK